jgi:tryptophan halogenase
MKMNAPQINSRAIKQIAVVGGGMTGWTVAAALVRGLRGLDIKIRILDNGHCPAADAPIETTTPACVAFHEWLGISEPHLMEATGASYILATRFNGWSHAQQNYFMPFGDHGFMLNRIDFTQYAARCYLCNGALDYDDYSLSAVAARAGKFCHPSNKNASIFSTLSYGLVLNPSEYTAYLRQFALSLGVEQTTADVTDITVDADGYIASLGLLTNSEKSLLAADLFIDCTGIPGLLIERKLNVHWAALAGVDGDKHYPVSHQLNLVQEVDSARELPVARDLETTSTGWLHKATSQTKSVRQYFYHHEYTSPAQIESAMGADYPVVQVQEVRTGRRKHFWNKNCVAIGHSAANPDVVSIGKLHLVQSAVLRLLSVFPARVDATFNSAEYNRLTHQELDHIEDFHALHYHLAGIRAGEYWQSIARATLSDRLTHKLELFRRQGIIPFYEGETFSAGVWSSLLLGNGYWPQACTPLVDHQDQAWVAQQLEKMKGMIVSAVAQMPSHADYLRRQSPARAG